MACTEFRSLLNKSESWIKICHVTGKIHADYLQTFH